MTQTPDSEIAHWQDRARAFADVALANGEALIAAERRYAKRQDELLDAASRAVIERQAARAELDAVKSERDALRWEVDKIEPLRKAVEFGLYLTRAANTYCEAMGTDDPDAKGDAYRALRSAAYEFLKRAGQAQFAVMPPTEPPADSELAMLRSINLDLEHKLVVVLDHATGGKLSKTSHDLETMKTFITDFLSAERQEAFEEGRQEGFDEGHDAGTETIPDPAAPGPNHGGTGGLSAEYKVVRHLKTGGLYAEIGRGKLQSYDPCVEDDVMVIYRNSTGRLWVRPAREFDDGRFETVSLPDVSAKVRAGTNDLPSILRFKGLIPPRPAGYDYPDAVKITAYDAARVVLYGA